MVKLYMADDLSEQGKFKICVDDNGGFKPLVTNFEWIAMLLSESHKMYIL